VTVLGLGRPPATGPAVRPVRRDFPDPRRARLAAQARALWLELEGRAGRQLLSDCGRLSLGLARLTPDLAASGGARSHEVLAQLGLRSESLSGAPLASRYPQFEADAAWLDPEAGLADATAVTEVLTSVLQERRVAVHESSRVRGIGRHHDSWHVATDYGVLGCDAIVIAAGPDTSEVLDLLPGSCIRLPLRLVRPAAARYFLPPEPDRRQFTELALPVFAYPDAGLCGHPVSYRGTPCVWAGLCRQETDVSGSVEELVGELVPALRGARTADDPGAGWVESADEEFIIGAAPGTSSVYVAAGLGAAWFSFAPWAGLVLAQLAMDGAADYDIGRYDPARFERRLRLRLTPWPAPRAS
jgi:sarcosine oxidase